MTTDRRFGVSCALIVISCGGTPASPADATRTVCSGSDSEASDDVFCIGLYAGPNDRTPRPGVLAYEPGVVLWSDGAEKRRYLSLPPGTTIDTTNLDAWTFPVGTKAFKEFRVGGKLVETRMLWKQAETNWVMVTYVWNDSETEAPRNDSMTPVLLDDGYEIPTGKDCGKCHHGGSDKLLGIEAVALALPTASGATLSDLSSRGLLSHPPAEARIVLPEDESGKAALALGFLHANCGMACHSTRGLGEETKLVLRLRADEFWDSGGAVRQEGVRETDAYAASVNASPTTAAVAQAFPGALRITPGQHEQSLLWLLSHRRGAYQMPPLVSHRIDEPDNQALADWIDALPP